MAENFQHSRNVIARFEGVPFHCEVVNNVEKKRLESPREVVVGDGSNRVVKLHDPAVTITPITLEFVVKKEDAFTKSLLGLFERHRRNPQSASQLELRSYEDDGSVLQEAIVPHAVVQSVKVPEGNTMGFGEAKCTVILEGDDLL